MEQKENEVLTSETFKQRLTDFFESAENLQKSAIEGNLEEAWDDFQEKWTLLPMTEMVTIKGADNDWIDSMNHDITSPWAGFATVVLGGKATQKEAVVLTRHYCRVVKSFAEELLEEKRQEDFDMIATAEEAAVLLRVYNRSLERLGRKDMIIDFKINVRNSWPLFKGSENDFARVFQNLFTNAKKALEGKEGKKEISVVFDQDTDESELIISVTDNGPGVKPEQREEIFKRGVTYFKVKESKDTGKGIGLAFVKEAVEEHKGTIKVEDNEGGGAKFVINLPIK